MKVYGGMRPATIWAVACIALLFCILLYPFRFSAPFPSVENGAEYRANGVRFASAGMLRSVKPPETLYKRLTNGNGLTVAVWLVTDTVEQEELSRIFTYSLDPWRRNFAIGQDGPDLFVRLKSTESGGVPRTLMFRVKDALSVGTRQLAVLTYDFNKLCIYIDGVRRTEVDAPGSFSDWDPSSYLAFGNEVTGGRPWRGTVESAAIYDRGLSNADVAALFHDGVRFGKSLDAESPIMSFDFTQKLRGEPLVETTAAITAPALERPALISADSAVIYSLFRSADGEYRLAGDVTLWDLVRNVILFIPLGVFVWARLSENIRSGALLLMIVGVVGGLVSAGFEGLQVFMIVVRTSSIFDVVANMLGALVGAAMMSLLMHGYIAGLGKR